ncbi:response regulator transcription factor, partial [Serratia rubidaea]
PCDRGAAARAMLTPREREIVDLILAGQGSPQIAARLFISLGTVKNHRKNIYGKLGIGSQAELFSLLLGHALPRSA